jgi:hypothetical protein
MKSLLGAARVVGPLCCLLLLAGCNVFGYLAQGLPNDNVPASYKRLAGQSVVVYVWADRGVRIDWPDIQLNIASGVQAKLIEAQATGIDELKGSTFPLTAASVARFQEDHPEFEAEPIADFAPLLHASRVIYVEISSFQTRSNDSVDLYRGSISAIVKVLEIKGGQVTTGYEDRDVKAIFPPKTPDEGVSDQTDEAVYEGSVKEFTTQVAIHFIPHSDEDSND